MSWIESIRRNRAAKQYAGKLPARLKEGWGFSEFYTPGQIKASVQKLKLNTKYIVIGYAAFLPEEQFNLLCSGDPVQISYHDARSLFDKYFPLDLWSASWQPAEINPYIIQSGSNF